MPRQNFFPFNPERLLLIGILLIGAGALVAGGFTVFLWRDSPQPALSLESRFAPKREEGPINFSLDLHQNPPSFPLPSIEGEMTFSFDPPRPDGVSQPPPLFVRLKKSGHSKRTTLPGRIDLHYEGDLLFSNSPSPFWLELESRGDHQIEGKIFVSTSFEKKVVAGSFVTAAQESPIQMAHEFPEGSPFRILAEARWWGHDLFREKYGGGALCQRLEVGPLSKVDLIELEEDQWIAWLDGRWKKIASLAEGKGRPIARFSFREGPGQGRAIILEGWDLEGHIRLSLPQAQPLPFKAQGDELFSSVRIRSEKQISCMLEKQCLILRSGDWVFKGESRWKILRKKEEREAYLRGKWIGELFVFDRIEAKNGQKVVQGSLFNPGRSQVVPIEISVNAQRKGSQSKDSPPLRKGKGK